MTIKDQIDFEENRSFDYTLYSYRNGLFTYQARFYNGDTKGSLERLGKPKNSVLSDPFVMRYYHYLGWADAHVSQGLFTSMLTMDEIIAIIMLDQV